MTNEEKDKIKDKWGPIINSMGLTGSKADWMAEYANSHFDKENDRDKKIDTLLNNTLASDGTTSDFPSILPMAMRVASKTVGLDLVSVKPLDSFNTDEELERMKNEVKAENRERKIDALTENKDFEEMKVEEHPDYKTGPKPKLFYLDFQYGTASI